MAYAASHRYNRKGLRLRVVVADQVSLNVKVCLNSFFARLYNIQFKKMKNINYHTVGTVPKSSSKIVERDKFDTPST